MVAFNSKHELKVLCWNIHGVFNNIGGDRYCKLTNDPDVIEHTRKYLIFGLVESHHTADDIPLLKFRVIGVSRCAVRNLNADARAEVFVYLCTIQ